MTNCTPPFGCSNENSISTFNGRSKRKELNTLLACCSSKTGKSKTTNSYICIILLCFWQNHQIYVPYATVWYGTVYSTLIHCLHVLLCLYKQAHVALLIDTCSATIHVHVPACTRTCTMYLHLYMHMYMCMYMYIYNTYICIMLLITIVHPWYTWTCTYLPH